MAHARNILRNAGLQVVPIETAEFVMNQMTLSSDEMHFSNIEAEKVIFAKAWATCLYAAAADPNFGREITGEGLELVEPPPEVSQPAVQEMSPPLQTVSYSSTIQTSWDKGKGKGRKGRSRSPHRPAQDGPPMKTYSYGRGSETKMYGVQCRVTQDPKQPWHERARLAETEDLKKDRRPVSEMTPLHRRGLTEGQ